MTEWELKWLTVGIRTSARLEGGDIKYPSYMEGETLSHFGGGKKKIIVMAVVSGGWGDETWQKLIWRPVLLRML